MPGDEVDIAQMTPEDCDLVFAWRNHPTIVALSGSGLTVSKDEHTAWFNRAITNPERLMFKILAGTAPIGQLRFDLEDAATCVVSIYILPEHAGAGQGQSAFAKGLCGLRRHWPSVTQIIAEVIPANTAAQGFFTRIGFRPLSRKASSASALTTFCLTLDGTQTFLKSETSV